MNTSSRPPGISAGLTLADVVDAAVAHVAEHGYETMTMRKLASALQVTPMTIYRHVKDKHDLLSLVADRYFAELSEPSSPQDWQRYLCDWFSALHVLMLKHPVLAHVMAAQSLNGSVAWRAAEHVIGALVTHGFEPGDAGALFTTLLTFTIGFALVSDVRSAGTGGSTVATPDIEADEYPHLTAALGHYQEWLASSSFDRGVRVLVHAWRGSD